MFSLNDRAFLTSNPYLLISGDVCKYKDIVSVEDGSQIILYQSLTTGTIHKCTFVQYSANAEREQITAFGKCFEMLLEIKNMIEINQLKG